MEQIFLALGSNVGNGKKNIAQTISLLAEQIRNIQTGKIYVSKPAYYSNQKKFINTAVSGFTTLSPAMLLTFVKTIEKKIGRKVRFANGPREIDIDIIFYGDKILQQSALAIPHPDMQNRDFVLRPLADIAKDYTHPVLKKTIQELLLSLPEEKRFILS